MNPKGEGGDPPELLEKEFQLYASELHDLYQAEKRRRQELAEEKLVLEYKLRELTALNILFQRHLALRQEVEAAYRELVARLRALAGTSDQGLRQRLAELAEAAESCLASLERIASAPPPVPATEARRLVRQPEAP